MGARPGTGSGDEADSKYAVAVENAKVVVGDYATVAGFGANVSGQGTVDPAHASTSANAIDHLSSYELAHLVSHLAEAGRHGDLYRLLRVEFCESRAGAGQADVNAWYEAKQARGDVRSYAEDVALAWRVSELVLGQGDTPGEDESIGLQCRYALLTASVASLAATVPAKAIPLLVASGVWSPLEGMARALQAPHPEQRLEALTEVLPALLQDGRVAEALAAVAGLDDEDRATALSSLAPHLGEREARDAVEVSASINEHTARIRARVSLLPRLPATDREAVLAEALDDARSLPELFDRTWILAEVASALSGDARETVLAEALATARAIDLELVRAWAVTQVASHLSPAAWPEGLEIIGEVEDETQRAQALRNVAPFLPEHVLDRAVEFAHELEGFLQEEPLSALAPRLAELGRPHEALRVTLGMVEELWRTDALAGMAPLLPPELLEEAAAGLPHLNEGSLARALEGMASCLPEALLAAALELVDSVEDEFSRAEALAALAPHVDEQVLPRIAEAAEVIASPEARSRLLSALAPALARAGRVVDALAAVGQLEGADDRATVGFEVARTLPPPARERALKQAVAEMFTVGDGDPQGRALAAVVAELASLGAAHEAVEWIPAIQDDVGRGRCLVSLAAHLPEDLLERALDLAVGIGDPFWRMQAVEALAPLLSRPLLARAVATARAVDADPGLVGPSIARILALASSADDASELLGKVPEHALPGVLNAIAPYLSDRTLVGSLDDLEEGFLPDVVQAIAPFLSEPARAHLVEAAAGLDEIDRAIVLVELAPRAPEATRDEALANALEAVSRIEPESWLSGLLAGLAPHLPPRLHPTALAMARGIRGGFERGRALASLAPFLAETLLTEALDAAREIDDAYWEAIALGALVPFVAEPERASLLSAAVAGVKTSPDPARRALGLVGLLPRATDEFRGVLVEDALVATRLIEDVQIRRDALTRLAPSLVRFPPDRLGRLWLETLRAAAVGPRSRLLEDLAAIAPVVSALGGRAALRQTIRAIDDVGRWWP